MDLRERIEDLVKRAARDTESERDLLVAELRRLAGHLNDEADRVARWPVQPRNLPTVSPLGVVQRRGADVDRLCATLRERWGFYCSLAHQLEHAEPAAQAGPACPSCGSSAELDADGQEFLDDDTVLCKCGHRYQP